MSLTICGDFDQLHLQGATKYRKIKNNQLKARVNQHRRI